MADVNTVVIVSDRQELVNQISQKLVLLRNLDKIKSCSVEEAQNMFDGFNPNVLILHCDNNNARAISLIKRIKKQDIYKNLPILLINENCSRETIIEAFDSGISDVLFIGFPPPSRRYACSDPSCTAGRNECPSPSPARCDSSLPPESSERQFS